MDHQIRRHRIAIVFVIVAAIAAAAAIGAWENSASRNLQPTEAAVQHSVFVQSGGAVADMQPSVPDAAQALRHARGPAEHEVAVSTF